MKQYIKNKTYIPIEEFIKNFKSKFAGILYYDNDFENLHDKKSKMSLHKCECPLIKLFTNGYCYHFAIILKAMYPGGTICLISNHAHIVYLYQKNFYDITGKITNKRYRYIPIEYLGEFDDDFKHNCNGRWARVKDVRNIYKQAKNDNNILSYNKTEINPISK